jgi:hypothetical protein
VIDASSQVRELVSLLTEPVRAIQASEDFALLLKMVLEIGNHMNMGTDRCGEERGGAGR